MVLFGVHLSSFMDVMMGSTALMALERALYLGGAAVLGPGLLADVHGAGAVRWIGGGGLMFVMMLVVAARWLTDRLPGAARVGGFLESARRMALADTGHDTSGEAGDRHHERLRADGDIDEDDSALDAYNALLARLISSDHQPGGSP